ncbi:SH3 domain-containing protein [Vibrio sp. TH_r3]|uniref:SH3 domain-containing protein n=1 Tax=Vibrio sp. TH_r3 TaxID=3082084 RepID=UPI00295455B8|nr:SH3 domain-containing protein [Vibrio sp. TH_r3]MDV7103842.1 SH3 domain-containing protein [Vibrio sp. TH_r3]
MKKIIIIILVVLLLIGIAGGGYYYFFMMNKDTAPVNVDQEPVIAKQQESQTPTVQQQNTHYFVASNKLNVRSYPRLNAPIRYVLRKGKAIEVQETQGQWVRISDYEVHTSGQDIADWVHIDFLSAEQPVITEQEAHKAMQRLLDKSDDFVLYQDSFINATKRLLADESCTYEDFELMNGWLLSRTYPDNPVYFVYCGGTQRENKIYLNVVTNQIFKP